MPTATLEEYLEAIYRLSHKGPVRPTQIAEMMGVSGPTVTATLRRLESRELITRLNTEVVLTSLGLSSALEVVRRHRVAEAFLVDTLGLDWDAAHEEACLLEHALSPRVLEALERFLDNPSVCPHGHPIPAADGSMVETEGRLLSDVGVGEHVSVLRVDEDDEGMLGYLGELGLKPGAQAVVVESAPFDGPLTIDIDSARRAISRDVARLVLVSA